jgi:hypothetical protein
MKKLFSTLCLLASCLLAAAQLAPTNKPARVMVFWDPNPEPDIKGYKIYDGLASRVYDRVTTVTNQLTNGIVSISVTNCIITNFTRGVTYYFAATAFNTANLESDFSEEASLFITEIPQPVQGFEATNAWSVLALTAQLEKAEDVIGPWSPLVIYPTAYVDPSSNHVQFFRVGLDLQRHP